MTNSYHNYASIFRTTEARPFSKEHTFRFMKASKFLEALRLSDIRWQVYGGNEWQINWIFRGQGDSKWPLIPSTLRRLFERYRDDVVTKEELQYKSLIIDFYGLDKG